MRVWSSSYVKQFFPTDFFKHLLADLIIRSKILPHQGAFSRLNCQSTWSWEKCLSAKELSRSCLVSLDARLNVLPLSDIILDGMPHLAEKRLKLLRKVSAVMSVTKSRCTARVVQHVYRHNHTLEVSDVSAVFTYRGPLKSTPVVRMAEHDSQAEAVGGLPLLETVQAWINLWTN